MMEDFYHIINNTKRKPIFCDLNNLLYRAYYVFPPDRFKSAQGLPNGHLFGLCQNIRTMDKLGYEIFLCEDSPCAWRRQLNEDYKANRDHSDSGTHFYKDFPKIRDLISNLPHAHTLQADGYEADDLMYSGAKICSSLGIDCYIFTADKDLLQALDEHITVVTKVTLSGNEEIKLGSEEYNEKFPVEPSKLPLYRAFKGDASDNIQPPVKRFPKDLMLDIIDELSSKGNLKEYEIKKKSHEKWLKELFNNWDVYLNNYKVMKLKIIEFNIVHKSMKGAYMKICEDYGLFQFYKYIEELA